MVSQSELLPMIIPTSGSPITVPIARKPEAGRLGTCGDGRNHRHPEADLPNAGFGLCSRRGKAKTAMAKQLIDPSDSEQLASEVGRLRGEIARLQATVERLGELAHLDPLVELPNRRGFLRQLDGLITRVKRYGEDAAMLFVDIDGLKRINDSHGHRAGDEALIRVSQLLVSGVRSGD